MNRWAREPIAKRGICLDGLWPRPARPHGPAGGWPMHLCDARAGDGVRLIGTRGKEAGLWLLLAGWTEGQSVQVLRIERKRAVLSIEKRSLAVPAWVARATIVDCARWVKRKSVQAGHGEGSPRCRTGSIAAPRR